MNTKQKYGTAIVIVVLLLLYFLYYYFFLRKKKEKCPNGSNIPSDGICLDNSGNLVIFPAQPNAEGCSAPASYINNFFSVSLGMKGEYVKQIQMVLNRDYNTNISEDGFFGCLTLSALKKYFNLESVSESVYNEKFLSSVTLPTNV